MRAVESFVADSLIHCHIQRFCDELISQIRMNRWAVFLGLSAVHIPRGAEQTAVKIWFAFRRMMGCTAILLNFMAINTHAAGIMNAHGDWPDRANLDETRTFRSGRFYRGCRSVDPAATRANRFLPCFGSSKPTMC